MRWNMGKIDVGEGNERGIPLTRTFGVIRIPVTPQCLTDMARSDSRTLYRGLRPGIMDEPREHRCFG